MYEKVFGFVDGAYLREGSKSMGQTEFIDPWLILKELTHHLAMGNPQVLRASYYDANSDDATTPTRPDLQTYWDKVKRLPDTELRFGSLRAKSRKTPQQQKGVDVLLAVDMVVGAFTRIFDIAILIAGDADFIPAVQEVRRRGVRVVIASFQTTTSPELVDEADRWVHIDGLVSQSKFKLKMT
jgi:uncharacterized LabA/DUF88 family protein